MIKPTIYDFKDKIEFSLIALIIVSVLLKIVLFAGDAQAGSILAKVTLCGVIVLSGLYVYTSDKQPLMLASIALFGLVSVLRLVVSTSSGMSLTVVWMLPYLVSAIAIGLLTWKHSKEYNSFESMELLLAVFLLITASRYIVDPGFSQYYAFGVCFLVATLMYNNNLWGRYKTSERNLLVLLIVCSFAEVIEVSAKYISF